MPTPRPLALALCVAPLVAAQIAEHGSTFGDLGMSALTILWLSAGIVPLLNEVTVAGPESPVVSRMSSTWSPTTSSKKRTQRVHAMQRSPSYTMVGPNGLNNCS